MSVIVFLVILSILVLVHELGHFGVAKFFGIRVDEFGLGYPPRAKKLFKWKGTDFTLNWLPFGGFVKIFGENPTDSPKKDLGESVGHYSGASSVDNFQYKNRGVQSLVLVAGVVCNFLFAWLLIFIVLITGLSAPLEAAQNGHLSVVEAVPESLRISAVLTLKTTQALSIFISQAVVGHADLSTVTGPVGLVGLVGEVSGLGFGYLLTFIALISINLCIINLLPFPALDGGRLIFVVLEAISRRSIPARIFNAINAVGFALLIFLMILITIRDVKNIL
ncbi:MAG: RIP metalloprotease [Candidatus Zambryskibacteria bacterium]|nr:RIP metalloprotease [Candidatus Zambryskibacteria bacterium]